MRRGSKKNRFFDRWLGIPLLNTLAVLHVRRKLPDRIERIGVMCSFALGDTLLFSAALRSLRAHFPEQHIVFFCSAQNIAAARLVPGVDELIQIDLLKPGITIRRMRQQKLDLLLDFTSWQRLTAFYSLMSGARYTVGFRTPGQTRHRGYDLNVSHRADIHEVENLRAIPRALGIEETLEPALVIPDLPLPAELAREQHIVVFHLWPSGVRSQTREWPEERWVELARRIAQRRAPQTLFVITGSPADLSRSTTFTERMRRAGLRAEPFAGRDGLGVLCQLLLRAELVVGVNTGVMHLAAILGVPTVSLNGPTSNVRWGPVGERALGVQPEGEGCGYLNLGFEFRNQRVDCMERISVDRVYQAVQGLQERVGLHPAATGEC